MINFRRCGQHNLILGFQIRVEAGQKDGNQRRATTEKGGKGKARRWEKDDICKRGRNSQIPANLSNDHCYIYIQIIYIYCTHTHIYIHYVLIFIHYNAYIYIIIRIYTLYMLFVVTRIHSYIHKHLHSYIQSCINGFIHMHIYTCTYIYQDKLHIDTHIYV